MKFKIIILIVCIGLFSCKPFEEIKVTNVEGFYMDKLTLEKIEAQIQVKISNPNSKGFNIYPSEFDVAFSGMKLGKAKLTHKVRIKAKSEEIYSFKLNTKLSDINPMDAIKLLNMGKMGNIEVKGNLKVGKIYFRKKIPIIYNDKVKLFK